MTRDGGGTAEADGDAQLAARHQGNGPDPRALRRARGSPRSMPPRSIAFDALLAENDQDIYPWITTATETPARYAALIGEIRAFARARIGAPDSSHLIRISLGLTELVTFARSFALGQRKTE